MAVFHPSGISAMAAIRTYARLIRPADHRRDCSLPAQLDPINLRHPSLSRNVRLTSRVLPYAGAARVKIKANLSHALRYQFSATCRPDVDVYNPPRHIYRISRSSDNISLLIEFKATINDDRLLVCCAV